MLYSLLLFNLAEKQPLHGRSDASSFLIWGKALWLNGYCACIAECINWRRRKWQCAVSIWFKKWRDSLALLTQIRKRIFAGETCLLKGVCCSTGLDPLRENITSSMRLGLRNCDFYECPYSRLWSQMSIDFCQENCPKSPKFITLLSI